MFEDDDIMDDGVNVLIDYNATISAVRMLGNAIVPARLTIKAQVMPASDAVDIDFDITFAKTKFWFENMVARSVIFCRDNEMAYATFLDKDNKSRVVNYLMLTPNEPTDEHLGALFQAKMTAFSGGTMDFGVVRVNSESISGLVWSYVGDWREDLPEMKDWFAHTPYYFENPWWTRDDTSTLDIIPANVKDFAVRPPWAMKMDFIENAFRRETDADDNQESEDAPETVIIRGKFNPKVIDGSADE